MEARKRKQPDQFGIVKILIVIALVLAVIILVAERIGEAKPVETEPTETTAPTEQTGQTEPERFETRRMTYAEMAMGNLVLVNGEYGFDPSPVVTETLHDKAADTYYVKDLELSVQPHLIEPLNSWLTAFYNDTNINDVLVVAGHRTVEYQQGLYDRALENHGQEYADDYIALPGHSEHHTGLAIDFDTYTDEGILGGFDGEAEFRKIVDEAWKYGFIQRYPPDKSDITGISYEAWHFRYVGLPHSGIMADKGLCLEEYIEYIKNYPYDGEHLQAEYLGKRYEVYYCSEMEIPVPTERAYTVSGNNVDGFIVTIEG